MNTHVADGSDQAEGFELFLYSAAYFVETRFCLCTFGVLPLGTPSVSVLFSYYPGVLFLNFAFFRTTPGYFF
jgi:hypothetical protein